MASEYSSPLVLITGASSGIGEQLARRLAQRKYRTLLIARRIGRLERLAQELSRWAPSASCRLDLSDAQAVAPVIHDLLDEYGPVDVLINNAGCGGYRMFLRQPMDDHRRLMQVNYFAAVTLIQAVLPGMVRRGHGHIINVASMAAKVGPWGHAGYAPAKAALVNLTQTLAAEYAQRGVHFSYVNPGLVDTEFFDAPCFANMPEELKRRAVPVDRAARRIIRLLKHPRLELCIPRHYRLLDMVSAVSPRLAHGMVARRTSPVPDEDHGAPGGVPDPSPLVFQSQSVDEPVLRIDRSA